MLLKKLSQGNDFLKNVTFQAIHELKYRDKKVAQKYNISYCLISLNESQ